MRFPSRFLFALIVLFLGLTAVVAPQERSSIKTTKPILVGDKKPPRITSLNLVVNSTADDGDTSVGDGSCATAQGECTLRAAIQEVNALAGMDTITFSVSGAIMLDSALPDLSSDININGPGVANLTVQRGSNGLFRIFTVTSGATVNISGLTISNGRAPDGTGDGSSNGTPGQDGGGIKNSGTLNLTDVRVSDNQAGEGGCSCAQLKLGGRGGHGGGIFNEGTLTILNSSIANNRAGTGGSGNVFTSGGGQGGYGGGIYNAGSLSIAASTVSENRSGHAGGFGGKAGLGAGVYSSGTSSSITGSTISTNSIGACPNPDIIFNGNPTSCGGHVAFGGGVYTETDVTVSNSTIVFNNADEGGGIYRNGGTTKLRNSIVARNTAATGPDARSTITSEGFNLIQSTNGATITESLNAGTNLTGVDPNVGPLAPNGGPTDTHSLRFDSPALDKGNNFGVTTDQRGLTRPVDLANFTNAATGDASDIGAYEQQSASFDMTSPQVLSIVRANPNPTTPNSTVAFTVTFSEPVAGVDATDFVLTLSGSSTGASIASVTGPSATRTVTINTGNLTLSGNGTGTIRLDVVDNDSIVDFANNKLGGTGTGNGDFTTGESYTVTYPTLVVTQTVDTNDGVCDANCSLREAIAIANAIPGVQIINFQIPANDPGCVGGVCTIELQTASSEDANSGLSITGETIVNGPGAKLLKVQPASGQRFRILRVGSGATAVISGLTVTGGQPMDAPHCTSGDKHGIGGAGIFNSGTLTLSGVVVSNNHASKGGNCNNDQGGDGGAGGGIFNAASATLNLINSTVSDNVAGEGGNNIASSGPLGGVGGGGGGISNDGTVTIINSTISRNRSGDGGERNFAGGGNNGGDGGGIFNFTGATLVVTNSTISGNETGKGATCSNFGTAGTGGHGAGISNRANATLTLSNSTVSFNLTGAGGAGFSGCSGAVRGNAGGIDSISAATTTLKSSILAGNQGSTSNDARGTFRSHGYNLIQQIQDGTYNRIEDQNPGTDITGVDPLFAQLADNGGPTMTHALSANSPALDKGKNFATDLSGASLSTDQRGKQRPTDVGVPNASGGDGSDIGAYEFVPQVVQPGELIISEFRTNGPGGPTDDYVELYNTTNSDITVFAINGSSGFLVYTNANRSCLIPNGTVIKAHGNFLCAGAGYSLSAVATPDASFNGDVLDNAGVALFPMSLQLVTSAALDRVSPAGSSFGPEGTALPSFSSAPTAQHAWLRDLASGTPRDTNDNAADFRLVSPTGGSVGGLSTTLGAPGPKGSTSPMERNASFGVFLLDQTVGQTLAPNRVRDLTPNAPNNSTFGTLSLRRRIVNSTGGPVTRLRFRIINITGSPVTDASLADVRAITSVDAVLSGINDAGTCSPNPAPCSVTVRGLTLDTPPAQPAGGGLNSTLSAGTISLATPLANGASIAVEFRLGVQQTGIFRFFVNVEALP